MTKVEGEPAANLRAEFFMKFFLNIFHDKISDSIELIVNREWLIVEMPA